MLSEFIDFVNDILPSVSSDSKEHVKAAIAQFERDGEQFNYMLSSPLEELSQGDILSNMPFSYFESDGEQRIFVTDAFVISTSCHIDQKMRITLAPVFPLSSFPGRVDELKKNCIYDYMYIPDAIVNDKYIDFEYMNTYNKDLILRSLSEGRANRIGSLNQLGYYFFVVKLTVFLMRKEDANTLDKRNIGFQY